MKKTLLSLAIVSFMGAIVSIVFIIISIKRVYTSQIAIDPISFSEISMPVLHILLAMVLVTLGFSALESRNSGASFRHPLWMWWMIK